MKTVALEKLALDEPNSFVDGPFGSDLKVTDFVDRGIPVVRIQHIGRAFFKNQINQFITEEKFDALRKHNVRPGDIVFAKLGSQVGLSAVIPESIPQGIIVADCVRLRPRRDVVDTKYLVYILNSNQVLEQITTYGKGTTRTRVNLADFRKVEVPLPPLDEQRRIAHLLEQADRLRRLRRHATQQTETFLQSVFIEMFTGEDSRSWPISTVEDVAVNIRTGPFGSQLLHSEFVDEGIAVLGIDNAVSNRFVWAERRYITPDKYEELRRYTVHPGDVLITIMGTCGRCAVVPDDIPLAINTKHICCITLNQKHCLPSYLHACFLNHPAVLTQLGGSQRGAIMDGLNMGIIKELKIPLPPMILQKRFNQIVNKLDFILSQKRESERQAELLFQSLLHQSFSSELVPL
jgi:type I restriction enzyme S subunit